MLALAKGDITHVRFGLEELLEEFQLNLDVKSQSYRRLGMAVLAARVKALKDIARRNNGEPVDTPALAIGPVAAPVQVARSETPSKAGRRSAPGLPARCTNISAQ